MSKLPILLTLALSLLALGLPSDADAAKRMSSSFRVSLTVETFCKAERGAEAPASSALACTQPADYRVMSAGAAATNLSAQAAAAMTLPADAFRQTSTADLSIIEF